MMKNFEGEAPESTQKSRPSVTNEGETPWYKAAFEKDYLERYAHRSQEAAAQHVPFLANSLGVKAGGLLLDLCCGAGRYTRALTDAGLQVIGLDLSSDLLTRAAKDHPGLFFLRGDMRALPLADNSLDGIVNLFTSFGYFEKDGESLTVLQEAKRTLKPGAGMVLDFMNSDFAIANLVPRTEKQMGDVKIIEQRTYDSKAKRIVKTVQFFDANGAQESRGIMESVRAFTADELHELFKQAGFTVQETFGSLDGESFDVAKSFRCVIQAKK